MYLFLVVSLFLALLIYFILNLPVFGEAPKGDRLKKLKALPLYENDALTNESPTPTLPPNVSYWQILKLMIKGNQKGTPSKALPHLTPDLSSSNELKITWFGHSSYLLQVDGLNLLVDPVFSERPSPFQFIGTKRFDGTDFFQPADFPTLDVILITHDHYDHLDYQAILELKGRTKMFVTSLGVGAHLEKWGVDPHHITELSWQKRFTYGSLQFTALPARHFSGRKFKRNQTLWSSFALQTKQHHIYLGGDSGYDEHFKQIGNQYGPFDLAILECGQYHEMWPLIHLFPEQVVTAAIELKAKSLLPVHWGKYKLSLHDWDEPILRVTKAAAKQNLPVITPKLGETFLLTENYPSTAWYASL